MKWLKCTKSINDHEFKYPVLSTHLFIQSRREKDKTVNSVAIYKGRCSIEVTMREKYSTIKSENFRSFQALKQRQQGCRSGLDWFICGYERWMRFLRSNK